MTPPDSTSDSQNPGNPLPNRRAFLKSSSFASVLAVTPGVLAGLITTAGATQLQTTYTTYATTEQTTFSTNTTNTTDTTDTTNTTSGYKLHCSAPSTDDLVECGPTVTIYEGSITHTLVLMVPSTSIIAAGAGLNPETAKTFVLSGRVKHYYPGGSSIINQSGTGAYNFRDEITNSSSPNITGSKTSNASITGIDLYFGTSIFRVVIGLADIVPGSGNGAAATTAKTRMTVSVTSGPGQVWQGDPYLSGSSADVTGATEREVDFVSDPAAPSP